MSLATQRLQEGLAPLAGDAAPTPEEVSAAKALLAQEIVGCRAPPVVSPRGISYVACGKINAVGPGGSVAWSTPTRYDGADALALGRDGTLYVSWSLSSDDAAKRGGRLTAFSPDGAIRWEVRAEGEPGVPPPASPRRSWAPTGPPTWGKRPRRSCAIKADGIQAWSAPVLPSNSPALYWGQGGKIVDLEDRRIRVISPATGALESEAKSGKLGEGASCSTAASSSRERASLTRSAASWADVPPRTR